MFIQWLTSEPEDRDLADYPFVARLARRTFGGRQRVGISQSSRFVPEFQEHGDRLGYNLLLPSLALLLEVRSVSLLFGGGVAGLPGRQRRGVEVTVLLECVLAELVRRE